MRWFLIASLIAAGCAPLREDVEVDWTFGGKACDAAGVALIQFDIAGEVLSPNQYPCSQVTQGADLGFYLIGDYQLTVSGFDSTSTLTYQTTQTLQVRRGGKNTFAIDVPQVVQTTGEVTFHWTFGGKTCAQAGITTVHVSADNQVISGTNNSPDLPCTDSNGIDGSTIGPFPEGAHSFDFVGVDSGGTARYALNGLPVTVVAGQNVVVSPDLSPAAPTGATANITWVFSTATTSGMSCAAANVDHVTVYVDPDPTGAGGTILGTVVCDTAGTDGASFDGLSAGSHSFAVYGLRTLSDGTHLVYRTHNPPSYFFQVGLITDVKNVSAESPP